MRNANIMHIYIYTYIYKPICQKNSEISILNALASPSLLNRAIDLISRVFANSPGDRGSIPVRVIPKTQKIVLDPTLLNTHYKVRIKGKVEQSKERGSALAYTSV